MKSKTVVFGFMIVAAVLFFGVELRSAGNKTDTATMKIGVVNIRKVFRECKRNAKYRADALSEQSKWQAEEEKLQKEIDAVKAGLKALKPDSSDHLAQVKELLEKQAAFEASRQYNNQRRALNDQRWTEDVYKEVLRIVNQLAQQKGLELVFDKYEPEFPSARSDELMLTLSTHKL